MATSGIINGTLLRIYKDGTAIAYATSCTLSITRDIREALTKDSPGNGWREVYVGRKSGTLSTEGLYSGAGDGTANEQPADLFDDLDAGTPLVLKFSTEVSGDDYYQASGYCTSLEFTGPVEDNSTYSASFELHGAITKSLV